MARNVVYIQANDKIAESFKITFAERKIDLKVVKSAMEAIRVMESVEVDVLLVDINIPDMRLSQLVEICTRDFPGVIMNVCVDVMNSLLVTKLVNRHSIRKIFVAPWDVKEMVEEIEESLDAAQIARDQKLYENKIIKENEHFEETLKSLTESLKKQQYSYSVIKSFTDAVINDMPLLNDSVNRAGLNRVKMIFDTYLKMQTTDSIDIDMFENLVKADMDKISASYPGFSCTEVISCLIGSVPKTKAANIRFAIWLVALCMANTMDKCEYSVDSQLLNTQRASFKLSAVGTVNRKDELLSKYQSILLNHLSDMVFVSEEKESTVTEIEFSISADSE